MLYFRLIIFPGTSCLVSKPKLATHGFSFTPRAYRIPDESEQFLEDVCNTYSINTINEL